MKRIIGLILITAIISVNLTVTTFADNSYLHSYIKENEEDFKDIVSYLKDYGGTALPSNPDKITTEDIVKVHCFEESHLPNYFAEFGNLSKNIIDCNEYKYFSPEGYSIIIGKNDKKEWEVFGISNELRLADSNHNGINFEFKDMIANIEKVHPNYNYESVKYIEYDTLGTYLVYFVSEDIEYLACYPINNADNGEKVTCGKIYTVKEYIDIIYDYPIFSSTSSDKGIGGGVDTTVTKDIRHWYVYPLIGVVVIGSGVAAFMIKRRHSKI